MVNVLHEDDQVIKRISQESVNDGSAQCLPDNIYCDPLQPALGSLDQNLDEREFAENLVECATLSKYQVSVQSKISAISMGPMNGLSPEELSKVFRIDLGTAKRTLRNTTQRLKWSKNLILH